LEFTLGYPFYKTIRFKLTFRAESPPNCQRVGIVEIVRDSWQIFIIKVAKDTLKKALRLTILAQDLDSEALKSIVSGLMFN